jgi:hypothetical protein
MGIDDYGLRSEISKKIKSNANYLDEINPKEKAPCQKLLNELDTKRPMPRDMQEEIRSHILDECKLHNISPEDILEFYGRFRCRLEAKYDIPETDIDVEETNIFVEQELNKLVAYNLKSYLENKSSFYEKLAEKQALLESVKEKLTIYADALVPYQNELDRLYRYKTTLERQQSAKLSQLIQLQEIKLRKNSMKAINE